MVEIKQPDYGLTRFLAESINRGRDVSEREVNGLTILQFKYSDNWHSPGNPTELSVVLSDGYVRGAKSVIKSNPPSKPVVAANIPGEPMIGYYLLWGINVSFSIDPGAEILREDADFDNLAFHSKFGTTIDYNMEPTIHFPDRSVGGNRFNFKSVSLHDDGYNALIDDNYGKYLLWEQPLPCEYRGTVYNLIQNQQNRRVLTLTKENDKEREEITFPKSISKAQFNKLEKILMTETDWVDLPRTMPMLQYLRTEHS